MHCDDPLRRRSIAAFALAAALAWSTPSAAADDASAWQALREGAIVLFRHATAPGVGDPPGMRLGDCSTQRNLDDAGRAQARRIGDVLRRERVPVGAVWSSQWCRCVQTAELAALGAVRQVPAFNSTFADRGAEPRQTDEARRLLLGWGGPGALVVVTHQVNISAITGRGLASGEGVVLRRSGEGLTVIGHIAP
jgi:phosphohistidine phosphatase SixA